MIKDYKDVILGEIEVARVIAREIMLVDCELKDEEYKTEEDFATEQIRKVLNETLPKDVEIPRYDITLVRKHDDTTFTVFSIYNNEDNGLLTPIIWQSHHYWDGKSTLKEFMEVIENKAYLTEDLTCLEEALSQFEGKKVYFNSEEELEKNLDKIPNGAYGVVMYI